MGEQAGNLMQFNIMKYHRQKAVMQRYGLRNSTVGHRKQDCTDKDLKNIA